MNALIDIYPGHHPKCQMRIGDPTCTCAEHRPVASTTDDRRHRATLLVDIDTLGHALGIPDDVQVRGVHTNDGITLQVHLRHPALPVVAEMCEAPRMTLEEIREAVTR